MASALVICENLVKIYKVPETQVEVVALQGLDLEAQPGELLAIVGRSGSGKTTLMNILSALDLPSAGQCTVAGSALTRLRERERNSYRRYVVGHIWQQSGRNLVPDLTLLGNVALPQMLAGVGARQRKRRSMELLRQVGLERLAHKRPDQLSGGEQQRGAIAVALANKPLLLLADEPTGELDTQTAHEIIALLRSLTHTLDLTVILVTHDPLAAAQADRTLVIRDGRTSTETIRREPATSTSMGMGIAANESSASAHGELAVVNRNGQAQLPEEALHAVNFGGRAELRLSADHVELWPVGSRNAGAGEKAAASAGIGLPGEVYREAVVIDRVGRLQLSEEALHRVPFEGRAAVRIASDHIELWPVGKAGQA